MRYSHRFAFLHFILLTTTAFALPRFSFRLLDLPPNCTTSGAEAINDQGWVLGWANGPDLPQATVLWRPPSYTPEVLLAQGWWDKRKLNNQGTIAMTHNYIYPFLRLANATWTYAAPNSTEHMETVALITAATCSWRRD